MRVFIHEYVTIELAGRAEVPDSLRAEGLAMFAAVVEDFARVAGVEVVTLTLGTPTSRADLQKSFQDAAARADWSLVIAPEFDDLLATRCRWVEEAGGRLLGPSSEAVRRTADKLLFSVYLRERGVRTPPCRAYFPSEAIREDQFPLILKPRFGAGTQDTYLFRGGLIPFAEGGQEMLLQPYVSGHPASVAFLVGLGTVVPLMPADQELLTERVPSGADRIHYAGGLVPLREPLAVRAIRVGSQAVVAVPGLRGYVGVDVVLGGAQDGSRDQVIEINPRLTTSYIGLRALAKTNLAEAMLRVVEGKTEPTIDWDRDHVVRFGPRGAERWQLIL